MKVLQINSVCGRGSTGRIATDLADILKAGGHRCKVAYGRETVPEKYGDIAVRIGTDWDVRLHGVETRLLDAHGFGSRAATARFLDWVREYDPDIIHLHNIHGYYLNVELLFDYLKQAGKPIVWTLHDCWAFTGHCAYFTAAGCTQWKTGCGGRCPQKSGYPQCLGLGQSRRNFDRKRNIFTGVSNLTLVTPSHWLAGLAGESFLREYPVRVIPNGIDLNVFCPTYGDFRKRHHLEGKILLLGVASVWDDRKGLRDFIKLSGMLDSRYQIVLVGLSKAQLRRLPPNITGISKTADTQELAEIYSAADVFLNPTHEDNFPTTNLEALACGTPVITYRTGGSPEAVDGTCGLVVACKAENIVSMLGRVPNDPEACLARARQYDKRQRFQEYLNLYRWLQTGETQ